MKKELSDPNLTVTSELLIRKKIALEGEINALHKKIKVLNKTYLDLNTSFNNAVKVN